MSYCKTLSKNKLVYSILITLLKAIHECNLLTGASTTPQEDESGAKKNISPNVYPELLLHGCTPVHINYRQ